MYIPSNLWQGKKWAEFRNRVGNNAFTRSHNNAQTLVVERIPHPLKFWKRPWWEIPRGPVGNTQDFDELLLHILEEAKQKKIEFVRVFPPCLETLDQNENISSFWDLFPITRSTFTYTLAPDIFSQHSRIIDLRDSKENILAQMKQKGRYNIRLAEKKGVYVKRDITTDNFCLLMQQTSKRDGFIANKKNIYDEMVSTFTESGLLLTAYTAEGVPISSAIFIHEGDTIVYYYGASSNMYRNYMSPYLLQWEAMKWGKEKGATQFDLLGIAPEGQKEHYLWTVSSFKEKFGGKRIVHDEGYDFLTL